MASAATAAVLGGCDPIYDLDGAFFPGWLAAAVGGMLATLLIRWLLVKTGLDEQLGWKGLAYLGCYLMCSISLWLVFFTT